MFTTMNFKNIHRIVAFLVLSCFTQSESGFITDVITNCANPPSNNSVQYHILPYNGVHRFYCACPEKANSKRLNRRWLFMPATDNAKLYRISDTFFIEDTLFSLNYAESSITMKYVRSNGSLYCMDGTAIKVRHIIIVYRNEREDEVVEYSDFLPEPRSAKHQAAPIPNYDGDLWLMDFGFRQIASKCDRCGVLGFQKIVHYCEVKINLEVLRLLHPEHAAVRVEVATGAQSITRSCIDPYFGALIQHYKALTGFKDHKIVYARYVRCRLDICPPAPAPYPIETIINFVVLTDRTILACFSKNTTSYGTHRWSLTKAKTDEEMFIEPETIEAKSRGRLKINYRSNLVINEVNLEDFDRHFRCYDENRELVTSYTLAPFSVGWNPFENFKFDSQDYLIAFGAVLVVVMFVMRIESARLSARSTKKTK